MTEPMPCFPPVPRSTMKFLLSQLLGCCSLQIACCAGTLPYICLPPVWWTFMAGSVARRVQWPEGYQCLSHSSRGNVKFKTSDEPESALGDVKVSKDFSTWRFFSSESSCRGREFGVDVEQLQRRICDEQLHVGNNSGSGAFCWRSGSSVLQMSTIEIPRFHFGCLEFDHVTRTVRMFNPKQTVHFTPRKDFIAQIGISRWTLQDWRRMGRIASTYNTSM